ncbi:unnamed protein product [Lactuca saligna]|uniref:Uncharacterized protein n=1 Tax=Lactuca saligna TaxID=75948 RepID=A0AA35VUR7_LACSI|nr:unnamed protein product [Lactuca saligna]
MLGHLFLSRIRNLSLDCYKWNVKELTIVEALRVRRTNGGKHNYRIPEVVCATPKLKFPLDDWRFIPDGTSNRFPSLPTSRSHRRTTGDDNEFQQPPTFGHHSRSCR